MPNDPINPDYYTNTLWPWNRVAKEWKSTILIASALKYLHRYRGKGKPVEDLKKAIRYIEMEIEDLVHDAVDGVRGAPEEWYKDQPCPCGQIGLHGCTGGPGGDAILIKATPCNCVRCVVERGVAYLAHRCTCGIVGPHETCCTARNVPIDNEDLKDQLMHFEIMMDTIMQRVHAQGMGTEPQREAFGIWLRAYLNEKLIQPPSPRNDAK